MKKIVLSLVMLLELSFAKNIKVATPTSEGKIIEFNIQDESYNENKYLIKLMLNTQSMDDEERKYWFSILPDMSEGQIKRLFNILETEKKKLEELDRKYQEYTKQKS